MTIRDSAEDSTAAAGDVLEMCKMVNEPAGGKIVRLREHDRFLGVAKVLRYEAWSGAERNRCGPRGSLPPRTMPVSCGWRGLGLPEEEITHRRQIDLFSWVLTTFLVENVGRAPDQPPGLSRMAKNGMS